MKSEDLGRKVTRGLVWSGLESFGGAALTIATTMILARVVTPEDYGLLAVLQIFVAVGLLLVESGFSTALIRLGNRTRRHESTTLAINLTVSLVIYVAIFLSAPLIADFYDNTKLIDICRAYALVIPLNALCVVQHSRLSAFMRFGSIFLATGIAMVLSSVVAIMMAFHDAGVRALVTQQLVMWSTRAIILWALQWRSPILPFFYRKEAAELFGFGWKLLVSSIIAKASAGVYSMVIGRVFSVFEAGLFSKSSTLASFPAQNGTDALQRVSFPALCRLVDDPLRLADAVRKIISLATWILMPFMLTLAALGSQAVAVLLGSQWKEADSYFSIICIGYSLYPIHSINLNILNVFGRSDLFLRLEIAKALLSLALMIAGIYLDGVRGLCVAFALDSSLCIFINAFYSGRFSGVKVKTQLNILFPIFAIGCISACSAYFASCLSDVPLWSLIIGVAVASVVCIASTKIVKPQYISLLKQALQQLKHK